MKLQPGLVSDRRPIVSLMLIVLMVFAGFTVIGPVLGYQIASFFYEGNILEVLQDPVNAPDARNVLLIAQGIAAFVGLIIVPLAYLKFYERKKLLTFFKPVVSVPAALILVPLIGINFLVAISPIAEWNETVNFPDFMGGFEQWARQQEDMAAKLTEVFTTFNSTGQFLSAFVIIAVLAGFGEELVFRGFFQNEFQRLTGNPHLAIWISAFLFSVIHLQFYGFLPRMLLGALFGYLYIWSRNLWVPMFAHFFHNGFTLVMLFLYQQKITEIDIDSNESAPFSTILLCAGITILLLYIFRRITIRSHIDETTSAA